MSDAEQRGGGSGGTLWIAVTADVMLAVVAAAFLVFAIVFFVYLYAKRCRGVVPRFISAPDQNGGSGSAPNRGLDPASVKALPFVVFRSVDFAEGLDCTVCLSELSEGQEARLLPQCSHGFHLQCIDTWLLSHSTCPLCRIPVVAEASPDPDPGVSPPDVRHLEGSLAHGNPMELPSFPTNVLFWGSQDEVSTGGSAPAPMPSSSSANPSVDKPGGISVIEIPRRAADGFASNSPSPSRRLTGDEMKSPTSARIRSLRRLLGRGSRGVGPSCGPWGDDVEQGFSTAECSIPLPKTPTIS